MKISGLSKHQVSLLNQMWAIPSRDELETWMESLSEEDGKTCTVLLKMILLEAIDQEVSSMDRFPEAILALDSIINK